MQVAGGTCAAAATTQHCRRHCKIAAGFSISAVGGKNRVKFKIQLMMLKVISWSLDGIPNHSDCLFVWEKVSSFIIASSSFVVFTEVYGQKSYRIDFNSALKPTMCNGEKNISYGEFFSWHCILSNKKFPCWCFFIV